MKTSSGTSVLPFNGPAPSSNMVKAPQPDNTSSFHEVMNQQGGDSSDATDSNGANSSAGDSSATSTTVTTTSTTTTSTTPTDESPAAPSTTTTTPVKSAASPMPVASDISTMLVQAAALASNAQKNSTPTTPAPATGKDANPGTPTEKDPSQAAPSGPDLATLIAQAMMLASNTVPTSTTPTTIPAKTNDPGTGTTAPATAPGTAAGTGADLSTMIAQASILASSSKTTPATTADATIKVSASVGNNLPMVGPVKTMTTSPVKEKKSASSSDEGTFLQPGESSSSEATSLLGMLGLTANQTIQSTGGQQLATNDVAKKSPLELLGASASSTAGTANVEKNAAMNADPNIPQALSGLGANTVAPANTFDMQIKLSSNNDFDNALKQVMHVAQLTQTNESRTPMRVAIEIQTPPGAVVNVYVSKQNDQWRAQLSTNDPVALSWVQDKMTSLRQTNDLGVQVRWLPPQMEAASTSSGNDANLSWDRGGQGQSNYQQPDERQQNRQQEQPDELPDFAAIKTNLFMNKLTAAGSVA